MKPLLLLGAVSMLVSAAMQEPAGGREVHFQVYDRYFVSNRSGLKGETNYLAITRRAQFDRIFHPAAVNGENTFLPQGELGSTLVVATIRRGNFVRTYHVEKVTAQGPTLYIWYTAQDSERGPATYASPLILSVSNDRYSKVIFMQNGQEAGSALVPRMR